MNDEGTFGEKERLYYEALGRKWGEDLERRFLDSLGIPGTYHEEEI